VPANLGRPVATTERFEQAAGEIEVLLSGAEELLLGLAGRIDRGEQVPASRALGARTLADRQVVAAVQLALRLLGNPGLSQHNPLERHFRDVQSAGVHAPSRGRLPPHHRPRRPNPHRNFPRVGALSTLSRASQHTRAGTAPQDARRGGRVDTTTGA